MSDNSSLSINQSGDVSVVMIKESTLLDPLAIKSIGDELSTLVEENDRPKIVVSMERVSRVSSAVLGMLLDVHKRASQKRGALRVAGATPPVADLFKMTKIDKLIKVFGDVESAIKRF